MVKFNCNRCGYESEYKQNAEKHINNKKICGDINKELKLIRIDCFETVCEYCSSKFSSDRTLKTHMKTCKKNKEIYDRIRKLEDELKKSIESKSITNNNIDNSTNIQNNIIIQITPYNDPNLDGAEKYYLAALKKMFMSVPYIIEQIHFNTDFPENHNLCIKNYRTKLAKVFNGKEWKTMDEDVVINELIDTYERLLEDWAEDNPKRMQYIEKYKEIKERDGKSKVYKDLKDEIKKLIYDKRDMIKIKN